jgi:hypothetical protein
MSLWPPCGLFPGSAYYCAFCICNRIRRVSRCTLQTSVPLSGKKDVACAACDSPVLLIAIIIVIVIVEFHMFHMFPVLGAGQYYYVLVPVCISSPACTLSAYAYPACDFAAAALACTLSAHAHLVCDCATAIPACMLSAHALRVRHCPVATLASTLSLGLHTVSACPPCAATPAVYCSQCAAVFHLRASCLCLLACLQAIVGGGLALGWGGVNWLLSQQASNKSECGPRSQWSGGAVIAAGKLEAVMCGAR